MTKDEAMKLAASVLKGSQEYKRGHSTFVEAVEEIEAALAEQSAQQQEPVAWWDANLGVFDEKHFDQLQPLYTSPPAQRTWVGLTDKETEHLWEISRAAMPRYHTFKTLIEKALRERNT
jgi:hypothetical protein